MDMLLSEKNSRIITFAQKGEVTEKTMRDTLKMYQVSTLQALSLGHTRSVIEVSELKKNGDTGLGTFEGVDGEMIMLDGHCYRAMENGIVQEAPDQMGVPFASVSYLAGRRSYDFTDIQNIETLKNHLNNCIERDFGLNSMHMVRIDGSFDVVHARSESAFHAIHISLKDMLSKTQKSFHFENVTGSLVCVYYPDYMDGINAAGWHFHFISDDHTMGGHVFELIMKQGHARVDKISRIELQLPSDAVFDTYMLKSASEDDIKKVEQGTE